MVGVNSYCFLKTKYMTDIKIKINKLFFENDLSLVEIAEKTGYHFSYVAELIDKTLFVKKECNSTVNNLDEIIIIKQIVADYFKLPLNMLDKKTRVKDIIIPRQVAQYITSMLTKSSSAFIGLNIGNVTHATILHNVKVVKDLLPYDKFLRKACEEIEELCVNELKTFYDRQ